jgi:hypothetical protein
MIGTFTVNITFSGSSPTNNFIIQGDAPRMGRAIIVPGSLTMTGNTGWSVANCLIVTTPLTSSFFSCQNGGLISVGTKMRITYQIQNTGLEVGLFHTDISTSDDNYALRVTPPFVIDMACGSTQTTTTTPLTTAPPVLTWSTSIVGPLGVCGTVESAFTVTVDLSAGREDHFLVRGSLLADTGGQLTFSGAVTSTAPSLFCYIATGSASWRCDGPIEGPLSITIVFHMQNAAPTTGSVSINVLTARRDDDSTDSLQQYSFSTKPTC